MERTGRQDALIAGTLIAGIYRIERLLSATGGTAYLYLATDMRNGTKVALKEFFPKGYALRSGETVVAPTDARDLSIFRQAREMFVAEATLMRSLSGETIVPEIYDILYAGDTVCYAMEYLDGESLQQYLEAHGVVKDTEIAFRILQPVFQSLMRLHEKSIVHRDVSPGNIFICADNTIRLIDFGNARVMESGKSRIVDWAKKGYAPIEQQDPQFRQGPWTDVYALAATAWRMVTGSAPPASKERAIRDTMGTLSGQGVACVPEKEQALLRALSVYPDERFATMEDFYEALFTEGATRPMREVSKTDATVTEAPHPSRVAGEGWLLGLDGQHRGKEYPIGDCMTLGRGSGCSIRFAKETPGVSGVHLMVTYDDENRLFRVTDVGSTYGTRRLDYSDIPRKREMGMFEGEGVILGDHEIFAFVIKPAGI